MSTSIQGEGRRGFFKAAAACGALASSGLLGMRGASAQTAWKPTGQIRIVVPSTAGGISDTLARIVAEQLQTSFGQTCIVDNKPGGGGVTGSLDVVRSPRDGLTLLTASPGPQATAYSLFPKLPYKDTDFTPVSGVFKMPNVLVVHPSMPVTSVAELVTYMRANPNSLNYGGPIGSTLHLSGVWFTQLSGTKATHVPYSGSAPAALALVSGQIQFMFDNLASYLPDIKAGKIRALGVSTRERSALFPELPSVSSAMPELADFDVSTWIGLFMASNSPPGAAAAYNEKLRDLLTRPATIDRFSKLGGAADYKSLAGYDVFVREEIKRWTSIIKTAGIQLELS